MSQALLDVNALIALLWPAHAQHTAALNWFRRRGRRATFDRGLSALVGPDLVPAAHLEIIPV